MDSAKTVYDVHVQLAAGHGQGSGGEGVLETVAFGWYQGTI